MDDETRKNMNDNQMAFHLLAALTKASGGTLTVKDSDLNSVSNTDTLLFYFDKVTRDIILTISPIRSDKTIVH
tara:strand:- start:5726 stop:5944 length:219 start_codon:yes stop_codon:yes gene_type:complete